MTMSEADLNLNLMATLDVLLEERNLGRAARRRGVTQSAMSHALRQLRSMFDDPLLVRSGNVMTLTPRAEAMRAPLRRALEQLEQAIAVEPGFAPARSDRRFRISCSDAVAITLMPDLFRSCARAAPGVRLEIVSPSDEDVRDRLESGRVDVFITPARPDEPGLEARSLYATRFVVLARRRHPRVGETLDLEAYCELPHVIVGTGRGETVVDRALRSLGRRRHIAMTIPYFLAAPAVVEGGDALLTLPDGPARYFARSRRLQLVEPPLKLPSGRVHAVWHERHAQDPGHCWLRERLVEASGRVDERAC